MAPKHHSEALNAQQQTSKDAKAAAEEYHPSKMPPDVRAVWINMPRHRLIQIAENHVNAAEVFWEPGEEIKDEGWRKVILEEYYGTHTFEADHLVTWEFLDRLGSDRAKMIRAFRVHSNRIFQCESLLDDLRKKDGPIEEINTWRWVENWTASRRSIHRDAVWIKLRTRMAQPIWTRLIDIEELMFVEDEYEWVIKPNEDFKPPEQQPMTQKLLLPSNPQGMGPK